ncbi:MAG: hypothetical protein HY698_14645 [Deltaproteobacteria bacterium]|nr:hypothetical protein [Deltaproteobacteria bacterium]
MRSHLLGGPMTTGAGEGSKGCISYSFGKLRQLSETFAEVSDKSSTRGTRHELVERRALRLAIELGDTAYPLLARKIREGDDAESSWAYFLLSRLGGERSAKVARELAQDHGAPDERKALALALLTELGAELPDTVILRDPQALREGSVRDLVASLVDPAQVAYAADMLLEQVLPEDLPAFLAEVVDIAGEQVAPLLGEFLLRDDVDAKIRQAIFDLRDEIGVPKPKRPRGRRGRAQGARLIYLGVHGDGRRVVAVMRRLAGIQPARMRSLVVEIHQNGRLGATSYDPAMVPRSGEKRLVNRLVSSGFALAVGTVEEAAELVAGAAARTSEAQGRLPRGFFLGRDLLGLYDEHIPSACGSRGGQRMLDDAMRLLRERQAEKARSLAERYVSSHPRDANGHACLSSCLAALGRHDDAMAALAIAARLKPDEPIRQWELSQAAKRAGKLGACYLALTDYLSGDDKSEGAERRIREARNFLALFEKHARKEHPDASAERVARAEELFLRAFRNLDQGLALDAVSGFEAVLKLVPSHYPSWTNLGAAYALLNRRDKAESCLRKALEFRPDYELAQKNLTALVE